MYQWKIGFLDTLHLQCISFNQGVLTRCLESLEKSDRYERDKPPPFDDDSERSERDGSVYSRTSKESTTDMSDSRTSLAFREVGSYSNVAQIACMQLQEITIAQLNIFLLNLQILNSAYQVEITVRAGSSLLRVFVEKMRQVNRTN